MSDNAEPASGRESRGVPGLGEKIEGGYQPQASADVDPSKIKPPRGDKATVTPQKPAPRE